MKWGVSPSEAIFFFVPPKKKTKKRLGFRPDGFRLPPSAFRARTPDPLFTGALHFGAAFYHRCLQLYTDSCTNLALFSGLRASLRSVALSHARLRAGVRFAKGYIVAVISL